MNQKQPVDFRNTIGLIGKTYLGDKEIISRIAD